MARPHKNGSRSLPAPYLHLYIPTYTGISQRAPSTTVDAASPLSVRPTIPSTTFHFSAASNGRWPAKSTKPSSQAKHTRPAAVAKAMCVLSSVTRSPPWRANKARPANQETIVLIPPPGPSPLSTLKTTAVCVARSIYRRYSLMASSLDLARLPRQKASATGRRPVSCSVSHSVSQCSHLLLL